MLVEVNKAVRSELGVRSGLSQIYGFDFSILGEHFFYLLGGRKLAVN